MAAAAATAATGKGKRKLALSEDDVYLLLHRYSPATILTALQEVAQHADRRNINWKALVAKTATGITSAREYQMLWRHFAYRGDLTENAATLAGSPVGEDSDLECEMEPVPAPSNDALVEASGFAKILISGSLREQASSHRGNSEAPVLNTANEKIPRVPSDKQLAQSHRLTNGTGPAPNSNQATYTGLSLDPFDGNGPPKKKKKVKPWSKEEDTELIAGVHNCGDRHWLDILHKHNFDNSRTPVQLSQRWAIISNSKLSKRTGSTKPPNSRPEELIAAQKAFTLAIGMPKRPSVVRAGASQQSTQHPPPMFGSMTPEVKSATAPSSLPVPIAVPVPVPRQVQLPPAQVQQAPAQAAPLKASNTSNKSRNNSKKQAAQPNPTSTPSSIQAAAIAAGGRIATQSVATNLLKAAQSNKAVHIRSRGTGPSKSSASSKASTMIAEPGSQLGSVQHLEPPNTSAPTLSPSVLTTHATGQVHVVSEVAGINPVEQSAEAHLSESKRTSEPCDNVEKDDDSTFCVVTMEDLFPEDVKQPDIVDPKAEIIDPKDADMLEFDRFVAQGCLNMDCSDKSKAVEIAPEAQRVVASQKKQMKPLSMVGKRIPVFAGAPATGRKTKTVVPHGATSTPAGTSSGLVGTGTAGVLNKALWGKAAAPGTTVRQNPCRQNMIQKQHPTNSKDNGVQKNAALGTGTPAKSVILGTGTPAKNLAAVTGTPANNAAAGTGTPAKNAAAGTGTPANRQGNPVVNGAGKGNPRASQ